MKKFLSKLFRRRDRETHPFCSMIVAAAGSSRRMGGENKLLLPIDGVPVLVRTLLAVGDLCKIYGISKPVKIIRGGENRLESVYLASLECREDAAFLAVHDGARPLASAELIDRTIALAHRTNAAVPAVPVKDTIKTVRDGRVESTPPRDGLRALLRAAMEQARASGDSCTDDCSAVEKLGKEIYLTDGSYENIKITTPEDMLLAAELFRQREVQP